MKFENFVTKAFSEYKSDGKFSFRQPQLLEQKNKYLNEFLSYGLPTFRNEDWKYTNLGFLNEIEFDCTKEYAQSIFSEHYLDSTLFNGLPKNLIHLHNGKLVTKAYEDDDFSLRKSFELTDIFATIKTSNANGNPLLLLNFALSYDGFILDINDNVEIENPFVILFTFENETPKFYNTTNIIKVGKHSKANITVLVNKKSNIDVVTNDFIGIYQQSDSKIEISILQEQFDSFYSFNSIYSNLANNSLFHSNFISLGQKFARNNLQVDLADENSEALINGIYIAESKQFIDNNTIVNHLKPNCRSNQTYRGVLDGNGRAVFNGKIFVARNAQKTNAYQSNKNILLSNEARINTKPQLEIYSDDVKCTHGATAGYLDPEAIFYLRSRGITKTKTKALLLNSFVSGNIEQITLNKLRDFVKEKIAKKLNLEEIFFCSSLESIKNVVK
ncbi:MAG: Fe-S cluster assembly protein SufD [Candidatus Kapaibacteriales bacterium]